MLLSGNANSSLFPNDCDPDLARIAHVLFNFLGNILAEQKNRIVIDLIAVDHNPNFPPGLNGIGPVNAVKIGGDFLQFFKALDSDMPSAVVAVTVKYF